jgi:type IV secretion system protein VirB9
MKSLKTTAIAIALATFGSLGMHAQTTSRNVSYHSQDIVPIRAKVKYTTLIVLPATEKIMEAATGDKDFWIVDVVGNFCFVHPAKAGISSNLNLITDKGNIYSFTTKAKSSMSIGLAWPGYQQRPQAESSLKTMAPCGSSG